jgi:pimeloyl-ACP methyl ester carboxylesterase
MLATTVAAAATAGGTALVTKAKVREQRRRPDGEARALGSPLPTDRVTPVVAEDGVRLHVEEVGRADAPLTVVFAHGWTCTMEAWTYQRRDLAGPGVRLVFYDQRGHGRSGRPDPEHSDVDILGRDLLRVIEAVRPHGQVVLVGHSMGGMTIMALADHRPDLFGPEALIRGVCLMSTSAGRLAQVTFGLPTVAAKVTRRLLPGSYRTLARIGDRMEARRKSSDLSWLLTKYVSYGGDVPPSLVELMERMMAQSPLAVTAQFGTALLDHDKLAALPTLRDTATLILVGDADVLTPVDHSRAMQQQAPGSDLVILPGAGHMVMLERPALTNLHLRTLLRRAEAGLAGAEPAHGSPTPAAPSSSP